MIRPGRRPAADSEDSEAGFLLVETIIAISVIVIVMTALTTLFISVTQTTTQLRARQSASMLADGLLDQFHADTPTNTYAGHAAATVKCQFLAAPTAVIGWLKNMAPASDSHNNSTSCAASDIAALSDPVASVNNVKFTANEYLGSCSIPTSAAVGTDCRPLVVTCAVGAANCTSQPCPTDLWTGSAMSCWPNGTAVSDYIRVVISITWQDKHCPSSTCTFVTATMLNNDSVPTFYQNTSPPNDPIVQDPANQVAAINDSVVLQLSLQSNTGVAPITWSCSSLPAGLTIDSATGLITGKPTGPAGMLSPAPSCTATDAFLRTDSTRTSWTWQTLPDLVPVDPGTQNLIANKSMTLSLSAAGGAGSPFTWALSTPLPPGLTLVGNVISGTPTTVGATSTTVMVTDKSTTRSRPLYLTFNVQTTSIDGATNIALIPNSVVTQTLTYTCPSLKCTFTLSGAPTGIGLSAAATGAVAASANVTSSTGTLYLRGTLPASITTAQYNLNITAQDTQNSLTGTPETATWTATTLGTLANQSVTNGSTFATKAVTYSCAAGACTISLAGAPSMVVVSATSTGTGSDTTSLSVPTGTGTIYVRAKSATTAKGSSSLVLTISDTNNVKPTSSATWTVT